MNTIGFFFYIIVDFIKVKTQANHSLTGDKRQARHFYLAKQFCFLDADCQVTGESQGSSRRSVRKYPVKPSRPESDSQTIVYIPMQEPLICFY